ncbi:MAG: FHA domain-containing protein [Candidatus Eisenbacteria bacterium]
MAHRVDEVMDGTPIRLLIEALDEESGLSRTLEFEYGCTEVRVGRDRTSEVVLESPSASRKHCVLHFDGGAWFVVDQDSTLGTFRNDEKLEPERPEKLVHGDLLKCSTHLLRIHLVPLTDPTLRPDPNALARLLDEVSEEDVPPRVWIFASVGVPPTSHPLPREGAVLTLGRSADCDIPLADPFRVVSAVHARVERTWAGAFLFDSSTNGIYVNGKRVEGQTQIKDGDRITITIGSQEPDRPLLVFTEAGNDTEPRWEGSPSVLATGVGLAARPASVPGGEGASAAGPGGPGPDPQVGSPQTGSPGGVSSSVGGGRDTGAATRDRVVPDAGGQKIPRSGSASEPAADSPAGVAAGSLSAHPIQSAPVGKPPINWLLIAVIVVSVLALATVLVWGAILLRG